MGRMGIAVAISSALVITPAALASTHAPLHGHAGNGGSAAASSAGSPPKCAAGSAHAERVSYVLRGSLSKYTATTSTAPGSVTITVAGGNCVVRALTGSTLTFALGPRTRVAPSRVITDGDRGVILLRGPKTLDPTTLATLIPRLVTHHSAATQSSG